VDLRAAREADPWVGGEISLTNQPTKTMLDTISTIAGKIFTFACCVIVIVLIGAFLTGH
jgi:hypothetical protein